MRPLTFVLLLTACLLGGCSQQEVPDAPASPSWDEVQQQLLDVASERGASAEQLEAMSGETVEFADYKEAVDRTIGCLRDAGIGVIGDSVDYAHGYPQILYSYASRADGRSEAETDQVAQECIVRNSLFIESLYRETPTVQEALDVRFERARAEVEDCLERAGRSVTGEETRWELEQISAEVSASGGEHCLVSVLNLE